MQEPSFSNGFASPWYGGRIKYPDLWRGCVGSWSPLLGPTGAVLFDQSGYSNHGTLTNMDSATDWVIGRYGHGLDFDGSNDHVMLPNGGVINGQQVVSLSIWVRWLGTSQDAGFSDFGHVLARQWDGSSSAYLLGLSGSNPNTAKVRWRAYAYDSTVTDSATSPGNDWHHIAITSKSGEQLLYFDGRLDGSSALTGSFFSNASIQMSLGAWRGDGAGYSTSQIAEFATWTRILLPNEIALLAQRPGIMYELDDSDVWGAVEAGGSVPWWAFANRQSRIIGGGVT